MNKTKLVLMLQQTINNFLGGANVFRDLLYLIALDTLFILPFSPSVFFPHSFISPFQSPDFLIRFGPAYAGVRSGARERAEVIYEPLQIHLHRMSVRYSRTALILGGIDAQINRQLEVHTKL